MHLGGLFFWVLVGLLGSFSVQAESFFEVLTHKDLNQLSFVKEHRLTFGGWMASGITSNLENFANHNNSPITFNDRNDELQLNQLNIFVQKSVDIEADSWNFGGRVDLMYGADSRFTQALGWDKNLIHQQSISNLYDLAIPQVYLEVSAPFGKGIAAKIGHFYTILGQEVVSAPNNFFYSHAYAMQYGEPFTHSGVLLSYALNDNFTLSSGVVSGWDNFNEDFIAGNYLGGISWASDTATDTVSMSIISGAINRLKPDQRTLASLVFSHSFSNKFRYVFQHDFAYQFQNVQYQQNVYWYSLGSYLFYDLTETWAVGLRGEWFRDDNGARLALGTPGSYYEVTAGINWKPNSRFSMRPELRYDQAQALINVYNDHQSQQQITVVLDVVVNF
ncbi:MAG: porin [Methylococcales bacterium]|nr:porin [Methylococcales bacterium]